MISEPVPLVLLHDPQLVDSVLSAAPHDLVEHQLYLNRVRLPLETAKDLRSCEHLLQVVGFRE